MNTKPIICCLGNPIGGDDRVGCVIGRYLKRILPKRDFEVIPEYSGSALDLVLELCGFGPSSPESPVACHKKDPPSLQGSYGRTRWRPWLRRVPQRCPATYRGVLHRVVVIDAIITGKMPVGTVRLFTEKEICKKMKPSSFHGVNLPQALVMGRKLKLKLPRSITLIGIEIKPVSSFGDKLSPALKRRLAAICAEVERILLAFARVPRGSCHAVASERRQMPRG